MHFSYKTVVEQNLFTVRASLSERGSDAAICRYSDWSSCSYFCGDPIVETRFKSLVEVVPKGEAAQCQILQETCATACTGEDSLKARD